MNAYSSNTTAYARAYIASDSGTVTIKGNTKSHPTYSYRFGNYNTPIVDWFRLNIDQQQVYKADSAISTSACNMFEVCNFANDTRIQLNMQRITLDANGNNVSVGVRCILTGQNGSTTAVNYNTFQNASCENVYNNSNAVFTANGVCNITGANTNQNGAGMTVYGTSNVTLNGANVRIYGNTTTGNGGGICISDSATLTLNGCYIGATSASSAATSGNGGHSNYAGTHGGGIYQDAGNNTLTINAGTKIFYNYTANCGGGIFSYGGTTTINGVEVKYNSSSSHGGGIWCNHAINFATSGSINIASNVAGINGANGCGGGIYLENGGTTTLNNANIIIENNQAWRGGGIAVYTGARLIVQNATIRNNSCVKRTDYWYYGGGIWAAQAGSPATGNEGLIISGGKIYGNSAAAGGGVGAYNCKAKISGGNIYNNTANGRDATQSNGGGGGVFMETYYNQNSVDYGTGIMSTLEMTGGYI